MDQLIGAAASPFAGDRRKAERPEPEFIWLIAVILLASGQIVADTVNFDYSAGGSMIQSGLGLVLQSALGPLLTFVAYGLTRRWLMSGRERYGDRDCWPSLPRNLAALLIPYIIWSFAVVVYSVNPGAEPLSRWLLTAMSRTLAGSATWPNLVIFLMIQCYLVSILLPRVATVARRRPGTLLSCSLVFQIGLVGLDYWLLRLGVASESWAAVLSTYAERCLLFWQFFVIFGVVLAVHQVRVRRWLVRHGTVAALSVGAGLTAIVFRYVAAVEIEHLGQAQATADLQLSVVAWGLGLSVGLLWLGFRLRRGRELLNGLARLSLGILLSYVLVLAAVANVIALRLPAGWSSGYRVMTVVLLSVGGAGLLTAVLMHIPGLAWLVGQPVEHRWMPRRTQLSWLRRRAFEVPVKPIAARMLAHGPSRKVCRFVVMALVVALVGGEIGLTATSPTDWFLTFPLPRNALAKGESRVITSVGAIDCQPAPPNAYASCLFTERPGESMTFYLWVPAQADSSVKYPLVLLLHGGGQRADSNQSAAANEQTILSDPYVEVWGPGNPSLDTVQVQQNWPSFVVVPQAVNPNRWVNVPASTGSYKLAAEPSASLRMAHEIVEALPQVFPAIDQNRLYVTGLSMGGYGSWEMIERWPNLFAAAAPLSGGGDPALAGRIKDLPIWAFHNAGDPIVPVSGSRDMIAAIQAAGGHPRYTELPGAVHDSWLTAYGIGSWSGSTATQFFNWLFAQRKARSAETRSTANTAASNVFDWLFSQRRGASPEPG